MQDNDIPRSNETVKDLRTRKEIVFETVPIMPDEQTD